MRVFSLVLLCLVSCSFAQDDFEAAFAGQLREFSGNMYTTVVSKDTTGINNFFYSPLSIFETLGMVYAGSDGNTSIELRRGMELTEEDIPGLQEQEIHGLMSNLHFNLEAQQNGQSLLLANAMFVHNDYELLDTYLGTLTGKYGAYEQEVDMTNSAETTEIINTWVEDNTQGRIQDLINQIHPLTRVILVNAVYFNATWEHEFLPAQLMDYTLPDGSVVQREAMLVGGSFLYNYDILSQMQFIALPYNSTTSETSYFIVGLPDIDTDLSAFNARAGEVLKSNMRLSTWNLVSRLVQLPKFEIERDFNVKPVLQQMGVQDLFLRGKSNLRGMSPEELYVSEFAHKCFINVNEEGTEAAAATFVLTAARSGPPPQFNVDRPFFFGIYNEAAEIFTFLGKIDDPSP